MSGNFSFDNIDDFDDHINSSIPRYKELNDLIKSLLGYFIKDRYTITDIGCSTGRLLSEIRDKYSDLDLRLIGYDISDNLLPSESSEISFIKLNLERESDQLIKSDVILSIFTTCFIKAKYRHDLIKSVYDNLNFGGCFILTDKTYSTNSSLQDIMTFIYYDHKRKYFKEKDILDKEISLRDIQRPFTEEQNLLMLREAGFTIIDTFWKHLNFQGYLCIK